jgi:hypothetical protein
MRRIHTSGEIATVASRNSGVRGLAAIEQVGADSQ